MAEMLSEGSCDYNKKRSTCPLQKTTHLPRNGRLEHALECNNFRLLDSCANLGCKYDAATATNFGDFEASEGETSNLFDAPIAPLIDTYLLMSSTLHSFRFYNPPPALSIDVAFWVRPHSTTWFSRFLLEQFNSTRWMTMFRMTKPVVFALANLLRPHVQRRNTNYRLAISVLVHVACTLFKLIQGVNLNVCSEFFAIGWSTVCKVMREVETSINKTLKHEISWP